MCDSWGNVTRVVLSCRKHNALYWSTSTETLQTQTLTAMPFLVTEVYCFALHDCNTGEQKTAVE